VRLCDAQSHPRRQHHPYSHPQDPVNESDLSGKCNSGTWACIRGILSGSEYVPVGFISWIRKRGIGWTTYLWRRPDGVLRKGLTGTDHCTGLSPKVESRFGFRSSCDTHDLGYALIRWFGYTLKPWGRTKLRIDNQFYGDLLSRCSVAPSYSKQACADRSFTMYTVVRLYVG